VRLRVQLQQHALLRRRGRQVAVDGDACRRVARAVGGRAVGRVAQRRVARVARCRWAGAHVAHHRAYDAEVDLLRQVVQLRLCIFPCVEVRVVQVSPVVAKLDEAPVRLW